jgi:hypothetical protein
MFRNLARRLWYRRDFRSFSQWFLGEIHWAIINLKRQIPNRVFTTFFGYKIADEDPLRNIPSIGEICWVRCGTWFARQAVLKERPVEQRMDGKFFRYYFELIDGCYMSVRGGIMYKPTGNISWEFDPRNPKFNRAILPQGWGKMEMSREVAAWGEKFEKLVKNSK